MKGGQRVYAKGEIIKEQGRNRLRKSRRSRGVYTNRSTRLKSEIRKLGEALLGFVSHCSRPEETGSNLVHRSRTKILRIADYELLCPGRSHGFETRHA